MAWLLFTGGAGFVLFLIGLYVTKQERKMVGIPRDDDFKMFRNCSNPECRYHHLHRCTADRFCRYCQSPLERSLPPGALEHLNEWLEDLYADDARRYVDLCERLGQVHLTIEQAQALIDIEDQHHIQLKAQPHVTTTHIISPPRYVFERPAEQSVKELRRLEFARYLVAHHKISEDLDEA